MENQVQGMKLAESYLKRARNKLAEAREYSQGRWSYPESISAAQECIEFSLKAMFLLVGLEYSKEHQIKDDEFVEFLRRIPADMPSMNWARVLLISKFWAAFYGVAKYGHEKLKVGAEQIFKKEEAELAIKHAGECFLAGDTLRGLSVQRFLFKQ